MPAVGTVPGAAPTEAAPKYDTTKLHNVRGKWYDLSKFNHPGGPIALDLGRGGSDCDELIRSYHPFSEAKVRAILAKYEVTEHVPTKAVESGVFDLQDSTFDTELKQIVINYFKDTKRVRTATLWRWCEYLVLFSIAVLSTYCMVKGMWFALVSTPLMWWIFGVGTFHDASHFAVSSNWLVNAAVTYIFPYFSSPLTWYYQHVVGHHPFVNIRGKDPDLYHHSPLHRYTSWHRFRPLHSLQLYTIWFVWCIGTSIQAFVTDFFFIKKNVYQHVVIAAPISPMRRRIHIAGRVLTFVVCYLWPFVSFPFFKALAFSTLPFYIFSALYLSTSQAGHILEETYAPADKDFYKHQIQHTHNYGTNSWLCFYMSGGLNMQIEHHLFPGLNHCHLFYLAPQVKALCKKHGVTYNESSGYFEAVRKHLSVLNVMSSNNTNKMAKTK